MDEADQANDNVMRDENIAIKVASLYKGPVATGRCISSDCGEELSEGKRFCNADCRDAWERSRRIYGGR